MMEQRLRFSYEVLGSPNGYWLVREEGGKLFIKAMGRQNKRHEVLKWRYLSRRHGSR